MSGVLDNLWLSDRELDTLTGLEIGPLSMGQATRLSLFRSGAKRLAWGIGVVTTLGVALVLGVPVTLLLVRGLTGTAETATMLRALPVGVAGAIALTVLWHGYACYRGRQLLALDRLLIEVEHYGQMLQAVEIFGELAAAKGHVPLEATVLEALHLTRENLVNGLTTERILRKHQRFMAQRQALFERIEQNLASLQALQVTDTASEYGRLLTDALQVGTRVHQELRALNRDERYSL